MKYKHNYETNKLQMNTAHCHNKGAGQKRTGTQGYGAGGSSPGGYAENLICHVKT